MTQTHEPEPARLADLRPHPRNYQEHPEDQLEHLRASLTEHGVYRNVVVASDGTILAGHGVVEAARSLGLEEIPVVRLPVGPDDPRALKVLAGDNELSHLAIRHDRALTEVLREIASDDLTDLLGTGYDESMLANLVMVTRPESEIRDESEAAQWVGLPGFEAQSNGREVALALHFPDEAARQALVDQLGLVISKYNRHTWAALYPPQPRADMDSIRFDEAGADAPA